MDVTRLHLVNFLGHEDTDLDLRSVHMAAITGSVGAGKTSLIEALTWAPWGESRASTLDRLIRDGADSCSVTVEMTVEGMPLVITRSKARGRDATLSLSVNGEPLGTEHTSAETRAEIVRRIGVDFRALKAGPFMLYKDADSLMAATPRDRKDLLASLLAGTSSWARWYDVAKERVSGAKAIIDRATNRLSQIDPVAVEGRATYARELLAEGERNAALYSGMLKANRQDIETITGSIAQLTERAKRAAIVEEQLTSLRRDFAAKRNQQIDRTSAQMGFGSEVLTAEEKAPPEVTEADVESGVSAYNVAKEAQGVTSHALAELRVKLAVGDTEVTCPHCGKTFVPGAVAAETLRGEGESLTAEFDRQTAAVAAATQALVKVRLDRTAFLEWKKAHDDLLFAEGVARADAARLTAELGPLAERGKALKAELAEYGTVLDDLRDAEGKLEAKRTIAALHERDVAVAQTAIATAKAELVEVARLSAERESLTAELSTATADAETFGVLSKAFHRDGIPTMLLESSLPLLEERANEVLSRMPDGFRLALVTQKPTAKGTTSETLDVMVTVGGVDREYEMLSGGQMFRVDLALRLGLTSLLAHRRIETLVVDEGLDRWQDPEGRAAVLDTLAAIAPDFKRVLVISHNPEVVERFDNRIEVSMDSDRISHARIAA